MIETTINITRETAEQRLLLKLLERQLEIRKPFLSGAVKGMYDKELQDSLKDDDFYNYRITDES